VTEPEWIFPLEEMNIGQSFFIPTLEPAIMLRAIESCAKKARVQVRVYITSKENHLGVRTWRVG
jgi:hypothetical protein